MFHFSCYWNNSGFKNTWMYSLVTAPVCPSEDLTKTQSSQPKALKILYLYCHLVSPAEPSQQLLPTHSCSSLALVFLPGTSHRATSPPCFMPRKKARPFQGPQTAWFRLFLFSWSFKVCFNFSAASTHCFCPQNVPKCMTAILCCTLWEANSSKRTGFSEPQSWTSHLTLQYPLIFPQRRTSRGAVWSRSFLEVSLHHSYRILVAQRK